MIDEHVLQWLHKVKEIWIVAWVGRGTLLTLLGLKMEEFSQYILLKYLRICKSYI